jgi:hypothetical protein
MNANLKQLFLQRDKLKKLAVVSKNPADWKKFKDARNMCNDKIRQAKTDYYHQYFKTNSGNPKEIWKSINELMPRNAKSDEISHLTCNDRVISDSADLTECFNNHFAEIGLKLRSDEPDELNNCSFGDYLKQADTVFTLDLTTPSAVFKLLSSLQEGKAMGLDEIPAKLLKCAASVISDSLCNLFNCSIATGVFPDDWKIAKVKPLHKGDAKDLLNNYRPISVLSAVSKIFERIVYDQLQAYLNENGLIYDKQSGFRPVHSTTSALLDVTTEWLSNMDKGQLNSVVFLDLAKAFDTVDHEILLSELQIYGVDSMSLNWFKSYLFDRKQKCSVNGLVSNERSLLCGVPQGSILGPLLFLFTLMTFLLVCNILQHECMRMIQI